MMRRAASEHDESEVLRHERRLLVQGQKHLKAMKERGRSCLNASKWVALGVCFYDRCEVATSKLSLVSGRQQDERQSGKGPCFFHFRGLGRQRVHEVIEVRNKREFERQQTALGELRVTELWHSNGFSVRFGVKSPANRRFR